MKQRFIVLGLIFMCGCSVLETGTPDRPRVTQSCLKEAITEYKDKYISDKEFELREYKVRYLNTARSNLGLKINTEAVESFDIGTLKLGENNQLTFIPAGEDHLNIRQSIPGSKTEQEFKFLYQEKKALIEKLVANGKIKKPVVISFGKNFKGECLRPQGTADFAYRELTIKINSCSPNFFAAVKNYLLYKDVVID